MGLFDKDLVEKPVLDEKSFLVLKQNTFLGDLLLHQGALICWANDDKGLSELTVMINMYVIEVRNNNLLLGRNMDAIGIFSPDDSELTTPPCAS